jgi:hypothetical protein
MQFACFPSWLTASVMGNNIEISVDYLRIIHEYRFMRRSYFMRNEHIERKEPAIEINGLRRKPSRIQNTEQTPQSNSLTIAVSYTRTDPEQVALYKEIHKEAKSLGIKVTDYMRRLCRLGRILSKDKPYVLFMPIGEQMKLRLKE